MKGKFLPLFTFLVLAVFLVLGINSCKDTGTNPNEEFDFTGVLVDATDNPVAEATVSAFNDAGALSQDVTDEFGAFSLTGIPSDFNDVKVKISANGFPDNQYEMAALLQSGKYKSSKKVQLLRNDTCKGYVSITTKDSTSGNLLTNVNVKITRNGQVEAYGKTGENGKISFGNFCEGNYALRIYREGYKVIETTFTLAQADTLTETFLLQLYEQENCCSQVNVLVKEDGTGNVIPNAQVKLARVGGDYKLQNTNEDGKTSFNNVCDGVYWLRVAKDGYQVKEQDGISFDGCDTTNVTIILKKEVDCCGQFNITVKDSSNGNALQGVSVKISKEGWAGVSKTTGDNGNATFGTLCPGKYWVRIAKEGYKVVEDDFTITECDTVKWEVKLQQLSQDTCCDNKIVIVVKNAEGIAIANAKVKLYKNGQAFTYKLTGEDGKVVFEQLCSGTYAIDVLKEGYVAKEYSFGEIKCHETKDASITLSATQNCCGYFNPTVIDSTTGNALQGASIKLTKEGWSGAIKTTGDNGKASFGELCPGKYWVRISKDNYKVIETYFVISECDTVLTTYKLQQLSKDTCCDNKLIIYPKDEVNKTIINGAVVKLWKGGQVLKTITIENGNPAKFLELCTGTYGISINAEGYKEKEASYTFTCTQVKEEVLYMSKNQQDTCCNNKIYVLVKNGEGQALANAKVKLIKNGQALTYKVTGTDGKVVFEEVCSGNYSLLIIRDGYVNKEVSVGEIKCEETKEVTGQMTAQEPCNTAIMKIFLLDYDTQTPLSGATVTIKVGDETIATGTTNSEGFFAKENLTAPKTYTVIISKDGYETKSFTWSFTLCKTYQETIKIKKN